MKWRMLFEGDNGAGITLTAWVTVLADDAEIWNESDRNRLFGPAGEGDSNG